MTIPYKKSAVLGVSVVLLLALSGCAGYKARPLVRLTPATGSPDNTISFAYKAFTKADCKKYLDRDVIKHGYQPVHISITNTSKRILYFSRKNISLVTVDAEEVAEKVHTNTAGRAAGYGVAAVIIWPLAIPAIIDGVGSSNANKQLDEDFDRKILSNQTIQPFETLNGLIFVPVEAYRPDFEIRLTDSANSEPIVLQAEVPEAVNRFILN